MFRRMMSSRGTLVVGAVLMMSTFLTSCLKNDDDMPENQSAALMAFNLAPDQEAVRIGLNGNVLPGGSLGYGNFSGQYFNVFPGNRSIETVNAATNDLVDSSSFNFATGRYYSLFVVGSNGNYQNIVAEDNYDSLTASSGKAYVRFINALSNATSSQVRFQAGGMNVINESAAFGEVSDFVAVDPGDVAVTVTNEGSDVNRTISLSQTKAYTVLLMGLPNQTDTTKSVQIRFIENGTVTD